MTAAVGTIGWKAHAALARDAGRLGALPGFGATPYRLAGGEPIWVGAGPAALHPRVVLLDGAVGCVDALAIDALVPWRLAPLRLDRAGAAALRDGCVALAADWQRVGAPRGFAAMLAGMPPPFPLDRAAPQVVALARALDRDDAQSAGDAAWPLLGLGPGLTPSGDDFVGAAIHARRLLRPTAEWNSVAQRLIGAAQVRTHAIGAVLFRDLAEGDSFAALYRLAATLAAGEPALAAAREIAAIGHSSGWDMLAGFAVGAAGSAALATCVGTR